MNIKLCFTLTFFVVSGRLTPLTESADILVTLFTPMVTSHIKSMSAIADALTQRGHNVTILTSSVAGTKGFRRFSHSVQYEFTEGDKENEMYTVESLFGDKGFVTQFIHILNELAVYRRGCEVFFEDYSLLTLLKGSHFDVIIGTAFDNCEALLSSYLSTPFIAMTTTRRMPFFAEYHYGIPTPSSYVPLGLFPLSDQMSFFERILSFLELNTAPPFVEWIHYRAMRKIKERHGIAPDKSVPELIADAELWLCVTSFALDYPRPTAPNWVAIGNIGDSPAKPLIKEFEDFIQGSGEHGFIVFSLGTHVTRLPKDMAEAFAQVLSELPQRVIWRYKGTRPRHLGNNTKLVDWLPQNDLLGHPKARLLIYHGGLAGISEAVYHAVPMVVMPVFAEQESNALIVENKGMAKRLQKSSITYEKVKAAITEVLNNPRYKENAQRISRIYKNTLIPANETVVFWVEHVIKFGGSHLKSRALELNFIQLHSIDVLLFIGGTIFFVILFIYSSCKWCVFFSRSPKAKAE